MQDGTILLVHGTGVRRKDYRIIYHVAEKLARSCGLAQSIKPCEWGETVGVLFEGRSLPGPTDPKRLEKMREWDWLLLSPLAELYMLTIRDESAVPSGIPSPDQLANWERLWNTIADYQPSKELRLLLSRGGLADLWDSAWHDIIVRSSIPREAFEASAHELADVSRSLARSLVAQLHVLVVGDQLSGDRPGPSGALREAIVDRLVRDWGQDILGLGTFFYDFYYRIGIESKIRGSRDITALRIGDILRYQSHGAQIRDFIRGEIVNATPPVTLIAHSLGGVACVDLLALADPPSVAHLVTLGSQSSFFYEIDALQSLSPPTPLPEKFPSWLNIYDQDDFLSFLAEPLFPRARDMEIASGQPFPASHSAYFGNEEVWGAIRDFITKSTS